VLGLSYSAQNATERELALYSQMVTQATNKPVIECFIHMPVVGALIEIIASKDYAYRSGSTAEAA